MEKSEQDRLDEIASLLKEKSQLIGMHFKEITHPKDLGIDMDKFQQLVESKIQHYNINKRYKNFQNGEYFWANLDVWLLSPKKVLGMFHPIDKPN
mgnify:CR=1 FL=1